MVTGWVIPPGSELGNELKDRIAVTKVIVLSELERLERHRVDVNIVAQYAEIAKDDPILSRLLNDAEFASIKPLKKIIDHLKRKDILKLVKPNVHVNDDNEGHH